MRTEELLEQCLQALVSGEELPPELARYLARHPEQRAEIEDLLAIGQQVSRLPGRELSSAARTRMQNRLASKLGFDAAALNAPATDPSPESAAHETHHKKPLLSVGGVSLAKLRYEPPLSSQDESEANIRAVFRDLTAEDIRRYIGVRGEDYLYYRQKLPGWKPVLSCIAVVLRGIKRLETLAIQAGL